MNTNRIMRNVCYAMIPAFIIKVYFFGLGNILLFIAATITMALTEVISCWIRQKPLFLELKNGSGMVTVFILVLTVPPSTPYYVGFICTVIAILIGKTVYGGLGQNIFNPAMVGVGVFLVTYPQFGTYWGTNGVFDIHHVLQGFWGLDTQAQIDGYTHATPLTEIKTLLHKGDVPGLVSKIKDIVTPTSAQLPWLCMSLAFLAGGLYLKFRRIIGLTMPIASIIGFLVTAQIHYVFSGYSIALPEYSLVYGAMIFGAFFIVTDPVTAPQYLPARIIYAVLVGSLTYIIRAFTNFNDGLAFAVLLGNALVPLLDRFFVPKEFGK